MYLYVNNRSTRQSDWVIHPIIFFPVQLAVWSALLCWPGNNWFYVVVSSQVNSIERFFCNFFTANVIVFFTKTQRVSNLAISLPNGSSKILLSVPNRRRRWWRRLGTFSMSWHHHNKNCLHYIILNICK